MVLSRGSLRRVDGPALLEGHTIWSWADLDRAASAVAEGLRAAGLEPNDRIGLVARSSASAIAAFHGLSRAGITIVPLGPRLTVPERDAIAASAHVRAILDPPALSPLIAASPEPGTPFATLIVPTSGTTARPKLVRLGLSQLDASADAWSAVLPPATGWLLSLNIAHVSGIGIVVRAAREGVPVVVPQPDEPPLASIARAAENGITVSHISLVAPQLARLLAAGSPPPPGLRAVLLGGGPLPEALVTAALDRGWPVVPSYGMTETASGVAAASPREAALRPWSAGRAMPGAEMRIEAGEILVRGPMVFEGYEADPPLTTAVLDRDGWLHTGDLGSIDGDGWLRVVGRRDEMIISGGENVSPAEVEAALATHPRIADVAVVGVAEEKWSRVPVALVVFRPGSHPSDEELRAFARERLASFKIPTRFVEVGRIPRTPNGKLLRRLLPALLTPAGHRPSLAGATIVPADDGQPLAVRDLAGPDDGPAILLLHATLSTSGQLLRLAGLLRPGFRVLLMDRRGSGSSQMESPAQVPIARHVADVVAVLDALGVERVGVFGHSFGAVLAVELAARHPDRVASVIAYEPPYVAVADASTLARLAPIGPAVAEAYASAGPASAAQLFVRAVAGSDYWDRLPAPQRSLLEAEGAGALADTSMADLDPAGLARIACPVVLATGSASDSFYAPMADALAARIASSRRVTLPGLRHVAPITDPGPIAQLIRRGHHASLPGVETP